MADGRHARVVGEVAAEGRAEVEDIELSGFDRHDCADVRRARPRRNRCPCRSAFHRIRARRRPASSIEDFQLVDAWLDDLAGAAVHGGGAGDCFSQSGQLIGILATPQFVEFRFEVDQFGRQRGGQVWQEMRKTRRPAGLPAGAWPARRATRPRIFAAGRCEAWRRIWPRRSTLHPPPRIRREPSGRPAWHAHRRPARRAGENVHSKRGPARYCTCWFCVMIARSIFDRCIAASNRC